jgi:hypothetical protein
MARRKNGFRSAPGPVPIQRGPRIEVPPDADPDHHLWRNGRLWWIAFTAHYGYRQERIRFSLGTPDLEKARRHRDAILELFASAEECEISLRFTPRRRGGRQDSPGSTGAPAAAGRCA